MRLDPFGDVLVTKAADCKMITGRVVIDQTGTRYPIPPQPNHERHWLYIINFLDEIVDPPDVPKVYIGGEDVTAGSSGNGYPLLPLETAVLEVRGSVGVFGITDDLAGEPSLDIRFLELV